MSKQDWINRGLYADAATSNGNAWVNVSRHFETAAEAVAFAQRFPKAVKVRTTTLSGADGKGWENTWTLFSISARFSFQSNGVTGAKNETSIKRFASFEKTVAKQGLELTWTSPYSNSITREELEAHL